MRQSKFPPEWDEARVQRVLAHYECQPEEESVAEDEAAFESSAGISTDSCSPYLCALVSGSLIDQEEHNAAQGIAPVEWEREAQKAERSGRAQRRRESQVNEQQYAELRALLKDQHRELMAELGQVENLLDQIREALTKKR